MMHLTFFPQRREYCFLRDASTLKPVPLGDDREEWFDSKEDARGAAIDAGYWIDGDMAKMH